LLNIARTYIFSNELAYIETEWLFRSSEAAKNFNKQQ